MMNKLSVLLTITVAGTLGLGTLAQARGFGHGGGYDDHVPQHRFERRVDRRQDRQWDRIQNGIDSGELSRGEARRLMRGQRRIARMEDRFERDGYISPRERRKLERSLNRMSKRIERAKRNDHQDYGYRRGWHGWPHRHYVEHHVYNWPNDDAYVSDGSSGTVSVQFDDFNVSWTPPYQQ